MSGAVIGLVSLILLLVIGAVIYFSMQEEEKEPVYVAPVVVPVVAAAAADEDEDEDTFDIVNGWVYDNEYNSMITLNSDGTLGTGEWNAEDLNQAAKWSFEPDNSEFYIVSNGTYLKITNSAIQVTKTRSSSSKIKIVPTGSGYKFSNKSGSRWLKMDSPGSMISVDAESDASTFTIEPSQYYIKSFETDKKSKGATLIDSLSGHRVSCDNGVLSSFEFSNDGSKYKYNYACTLGDAATADLLDKTLLEPDNLENGTGIVGNSFDVSCESGALANFRLSKGVAENTASYEYTCRDIGVSDETTVVTTGPVEFVGGENAVYEGMLAKFDPLTCDDGKVLTGFKYTGGTDNNDEYTLSGICKKLA
jgi:hypothetical protein